MIFRQVFDHESSTYTYILGDEVTREGIIIDPVLEQVERDSKLIEELGLKLKYILETHVHADHITGSAQLKERFKEAKAVVGRGANIPCADQLIGDGETLSFGPHEIRALSTPGHTDSCTTYQIADMLFTGDTLLIRGCGRTDFQQGSSEKLFESVRQKIFSFPDATRIFPAHDYKGLTMTSVGEEKAYNPRLKISNSREDFIQIMSQLKLAQPKKIQEAVPANMKCGRV